jgi:hypothetical protein
MDRAMGRRQSHGVEAKRRGGDLVDGLRAGTPQQHWCEEHSGEEPTLLAFHITLRCEEHWCEEPTWLSRPCVMA